MLQFCIALRYYATGSFYSAIGDGHGVQKSTVCRAVADVTDYLCEVHPRYIRFPNRADFPMCAQDFAQQHGFPCVIGCLDGTHIAIQAPSVEEKSYVNRKGYHSLNVMVHIGHCSLAWYSSYD